MCLGQLSQSCCWSQEIAPPVKAAIHAPLIMSLVEKDFLLDFQWDCWLQSLYVMCRTVNIATCQTQVISKEQNHYLVFKGNSYTPRTLRACCSQSKFRILKIRESSARALFLYNALRTYRAVLTRAWASRRVDLRERRVDSFSKRVIIFCW